MISPTTMRGFSDEYGSWNTICNTVPPQPPQFPTFQLRQIDTGITNIEFDFS